MQPIKTLNATVLKTVFCFSITIFSSLLTAVPVRAADCAPLPTQSQATMTFLLERADIYRLWLRNILPANTNTQIIIDIDGQCPVTLGSSDTKSSFTWIGNNAQNEPLIYALSAGQHTITIAGDKTGIIVDKGLLTNDLACTPGGFGSNCTITISQPIPETSISGPSLIIQLQKRFGLLVIILSAIALVYALGFLLWKYHVFVRKVHMPMIKVKQSGWRAFLRHAFSLEAVRHFVGHHRIFAIIMGIIISLLIASLWLGIANAVQNEPGHFEPESGTLTGGAQVVSNNDASGGSAVLVGELPTSGTGGSNSPSTNPGSSEGSGGSNNNGGGTGSGGGGGGDTGGGGGGSPQEICPAWPTFPDQNCTGWEHTGVTLHNCDDLLDGNGSGDFWIWDDTPTKTFDSCYFSGNVTVQSAGVTITRSQVHGSISPHWSSNYSLRGLTLVDVEIEQEGVAVPRGAVGGNDWSCLRCDAHHGVTGMHFGDNTTIRDSYVHDMQWLEESHGSGIATGQDHGSNSSIIHNNIQCNRVNGPPICSSALSIYPEDDNGDGITVHNVQVEKNLFNATGAYCVYAVDVPGSNVNFIDNYFGKKFYPGCAGYGPVASYSPLGGQWIGNVWADGSGPVVP